MKTKFNFIVAAAAAALALVSQSASATISVGADPSLLFVAVDQVTGSTYVRNLGAESQLASGSLAFSTPATNVFSTLFNGDTNISWNVMAFSGASNVIYSTGDVSTNFGFVNAGDAQQIIQAETAALGGITALDNTSNSFSKGNNEYVGATGSGSINPTNGVQLNLNAGFGFPTYGTVGGSRNFIKTDNDGNVSQLFLNSSLTAIDDNQKGGFFTLTDAQGDLSWTNAGSVAAVPLPGAALLFFPGLLAMFGIGRRNKKLAA